MYHRILFAWRLAVGWTTEESEFESAYGQIFSPAQWLPQPPVQGIPGVLSTGENGQRSPPASADIHSPVRLDAVVLK
jgi:hypothetical protein